MYIYVLWCELDLGFNDVCFLTVDSAIEYAKETLINYDVEDSYEKLEEWGLIGWRELRIK